MTRQRIFAACAPGFEPVLAAELGRLGLAARAVPGGAEAEGEDAAAIACLGSRAADAVALRLWQGPERDLPAGKREAARSSGGAPLAIRVDGGAATISVDAAGAPLFKRGWRARVGAAPLRESLAAGVLLACGWDGEAPFLDPMCGSGTIAIEAALLASGRAPGLGRRFAFEALPGHDPARTERLRARLAAEARPVRAAVHASDRNAGALRIAQKNAAAAGVEGAIRFAREDAAHVVPPPVAGLCATNPPYGVRLGDSASDAWRALAALFPRLRGWQVAVLAPDRGFERLLPGMPDESIPVRNGGVACRLVRYRR